VRAAFKSCCRRSLRRWRRDACCFAFFAFHRLDPTLAALVACRVVSACWEKCVPKPRDDQLTIGEMSCVDRCVAKYLETQSIVKAELETARNKVPLPYP